MLIIFFYQAIMFFFVKKKESNNVLSPNKKKKNARILGMQAYFVDFFCVRRISSYSNKPLS